MAHEHQPQSTERLREGPSNVKRHRAGGDVEEYKETEARVDEGKVYKRKVSIVPSEHRVIVRGRAEEIDEPTNESAKERVLEPRVYKWVEEIGSGAFGIVWKARHLGSGKIVAIKAPMSHNDAHLVREACMLDTCQGIDEVPTLHDVTRDPMNGRTRIVMDYVGPSLFDIMVERAQRGHGFSEEEVYHVVKTLLGAASKIHARGIVHGDIKPDNILVSNGSLACVKLCDFGLAWSIRSFPQYRPKGPEGTMWYMSPEHFIGSSNYGTHSDIWAIGCVMGELLIGKPLFRGTDMVTQPATIVKALGVSDDESLMPLGINEGSCFKEFEQLLRKRQLSCDGVDVLRQLLLFNHHRRLNAHNILQMPWFTK